MNIFKYLKEHFIRKMHEKRGTWWGVSTTVASTAYGMYNQSQQGGGEGVGPQLLKLPDYEGFAGERNAQSQYAQNMMQRNQQGMVTQGFQDYLDPIMQNRRRQLQENFFGRPGDRSESVYGAAQQMGAMGGVGPKALMAQGRKASQDYAGQAANIEEYMNQIQMQQFQQEQKLAPQILQGLPQGPRYQGFGAQQAPQRPDYMGQALNTIGMAAPWLGGGGGGTTNANQWLQNTNNSNPMAISDGTNWNQAGLDQYFSQF